MSRKAGAGKEHKSFRQQHKSGVNNTRNKRERLFDEFREAFMKEKEDGNQNQVLEAKLLH